jgi:hypothetical protein
MSQPPYPYNRIFDFESFSINTPAAQQPGVQLEGEYDAIKLTIDSLISRLSEIQRDDGKLRGEAFDTTTAGAVYTAILALLQPTLALKANLASPALTGTPTAPTPVTNSNNTTIATTAFVKAQGYATTSSLNNAIDGVESLVDAVNLRVNATNEEVTHKLDKRTGGTVVGDVSLGGNLGLNGFGSTLEFKYGNNPAITRLTKGSIECLSGENGEGGYSTINSGLLAVAKSLIGFAQLQPNKISVSNQFGALSVELSSAGLKFLDGTLQSTAFTPADYATNTSVDTKIATRLPLAGGTMTGNLIVDANGGTHAQVDPSEIFTTQTNANTGAGESNAYGALYNGGVEVGNTAGKWAELTPNRLRLGNTASLEKGSFDSGRGGDFGISLICTNNVELNWQSGYLKSKYNGSVAPINVEDSDLNFVNSGTTPNGINFTNTVPFAGGTNTTTTSFNVNGITNSDSVGENSFNLSVNSVGGRAGDDLHFGLSGNGVSFGEQSTNYTYDMNGINGYGWSISKDNGIVGIDFHGDITNNAMKYITDMGVTTEYPVSASIVTSAENGISLKWLGGGGEFFDSEIKLYDGVNTFTGTNNFAGKVSLNPTGTTTAPLNLKTGITPTGAVAGDVWISTGAIRYKDAGGVERIVADTNRSNTYTTNNVFQNSTSNPTVTINASGTGTALKVTNTGTGESLRVEDETSPDATAFVVSNNGRVGIGVAPDATVALTVDSTGIKVNGAKLIPAATVTNAPVTSGNMSHSEYTKELLININGVNYAIVLRVV